MKDSLDLGTLAARYREGALAPTTVVEEVLDRIAGRGDDKVWIHVLPRAELLDIAKALEKSGPADKPLYGIPFAIKDNIDLAGHPTTAGCPGYAYVPATSATVVQRLIAAGAIPIGKTNLDQFATGLNGTRSPYGPPGSAINPAYASGGSSSGSAVAVAAGLVTFSLGTDTAGSGRVPAQWLNTRLGYYTNFKNLLDLSAIAIPAGFQNDGLPFGVTLAAPAFADAGLLALGDEIHRSQGLTVGALDHTLPPKRHASASGASVRLAVCGAHMSGLPLNGQLTDRGARLVRACRTAPRYRLYALPGGPPARPGMLRAEPGRAIEVEVWEMPLAAFGSFVDGIPPPLGIGTVELEDGTEVKGFICETYGTKDARDISELGGWRPYIAEGRLQPAAS